MPSSTEICNAALQRLGAKSIVSLTENSVNARACNLIYNQTRDAELRTRAWNFAIKRVILPASATPLVYGDGNIFPLPADFIKLLHPDPGGIISYTSSPIGYYLGYNDWMIEGQSIVTTDQAPLNVRYVWRVEDVNLMDTLFRDGLSCKLAANLCEILTQSNSKKASALQDYKDTIAEARKQNAFEKPSAIPQEDIYISLRN